MQDFQQDLGLKNQENSFPNQKNFAKLKLPKTDFWVEKLGTTEWNKKVEALSCYKFMGLY